MLKKSLLLIVIFFTSSAYASTSKVKEYKSFADFKDGEFKSVSLSEKGELSIAPAVAKYFDAATQHVWQIASAGGKMYAATGTPLKIYQMTGKDSTTVYTSEAPTLFAMTGSGNGVLYFAPAPGGIIYKFQNGTVSEIANLETKYIWHLLPDNDDVLVATGDPGLILRITQQGNVDTVFTSTETHIRVLALDAKGMLYAGSADHGLVYRFNKNLKPFVLYDSPETEIFSIIPLKNGEIWVAGMSEKLTRPVITPASVSSPSSGSAGQAEVKNGSDPLEALMANGAGSKGGIYRITANGVARNFWQGQSQRVQALALRNDGNVLVGTGDAGKLYLLDRNGEITQLLDIDSEQIANFYPLQKSVLLATSNNGAIYELDAKPALKGQYLSEAFDAGSFTNWGSLSWSGQGSIAFSVRSGNTEKPDATWSEWAKLPISADPVAISSPTARFIQWQAELSNNAVLQSLTFGYKQQNIAPVLQEIKIHKPEDAYLEDVKEGLQGKPQKTGATLGKKSSEKGFQSVSWTMSDDNDDPLFCTLWVQLHGTQSWRLMVKDYGASVYSWDTRTLEDGYYHVKIEVSDKYENFNTSLVETKITDNFLVDNTAPVVSDLLQKGNAVKFQAIDKFSRIQKVQFAIDTGEWQSIFPLDGITDSSKEQFSIELPPLSKGEHTVMIKTEDERDNSSYKHINIHY